MKNTNLKKNVIYNIIYKMTSVLFPVIVYPYVTRVLSADNMGKVAFFLSLVSYCLMLGSLGIGTYGVREVAKIRDDNIKLSRLVKELMRINFIVTLSVIIILLFSTIFVEKFRADLMIFVICCFQILMAPLSLEWLFNGLEQYAYIAKRAIIIKLFTLILIFTLVKNKSDYVLYAGITIGGFVLTYILNFLYSHKFINYSVKTPFVFKKHVKYTIILFASILAINVYTNVDTLMLGFIKGDRAVGLYDIAVKAKTVLLALINAISATLYPRLSYYIEKKDNNSYKKILEKSFIIIYALALFTMSYFIICAKDVVLVLGGEEYKSATLCMQILMPILIISGLSNVTGNQILLPNGRDLSYMKAVMLGAATDIVLNVFLIPKYSFYGAAIATLLAEISQFSYQCYKSRDIMIGTIKIAEILKVTLSNFLAICVTLIIDIFLKESVILRLVSLFISYAFVYFISAYFLKVSIVYTICSELKKIFSRDDSINTE